VLFLSDKRANMFGSSELVYFLAYKIGCSYKLDSFYLSPPTLIFNDEIITNWLPIFSIKETHYEKSFQAF